MKKASAFLLPGLALSIGSMWCMNRPEPVRPASQADVIEYSIELPGDILSLTHGFADGIGRTPKTITSLENSAVSNMLGFTARIEDEGIPAAHLPAFASGQTSGMSSHHSG